MANSNSTWLARRRWDLTRFGFDPAGLRLRLRPAGPRILTVSVPKAGTHLLERVLCLHPGAYRKLRRTVNRRNVESYGGSEPLVSSTRAGQIVMTHLAHSGDLAAAIRSDGLRSIFMVRDPRAITISQADYIAREQNHIFHHGLEGLDREARIRKVLEGIDAIDMPSISNYMEWFSPWFDEPDVLLVRFEHLVGARGGGTEDDQQAAVAAILDHCHLPHDDALLRRIASEAFGGPSPTFFKGSVDRWQGMLTGSLGEYAHETLAPWIERYGYA